MTLNRVAVTGLGVISPIGIGVQAYWDSLMAGRSGARLITFDDFDMSQYGSRVACPVDDFSLESLIAPSKELKYLGRTSQFAVGATKLALEDAGLALDVIERGRGEVDYLLRDLAAEQAGVIVGAGVDNMDLCEKYHRRLIECRGPKKISPFALPHVQIGSVAANVSKKFGIKGFSFTVSTACASSLHAMIEAWCHIAAGRQTLIVSGGAEACITAYAFGGFDAMHAMSRHNDEPRKACRPFDKDRDGFVMGEGAGIVILEELKHARQRGARIYAEITGFGMTSDAYHITMPDPDAVSQAAAITQALAMAGLRPEQIDYVNAHGTSTPLNDPLETMAIKKAFGGHAHSLAVSATKSATGHLIGGAGGVEVIATALMLQHGCIVPTINLENQDYDGGCDLNYTPNTPEQKPIARAIKNSFGFGGQNAVVVLDGVSAAG